MIFLGTGLGARGYAIIGQGMINRLIEAKPEELRVYLEEAAVFRVIKSVVKKQKVVCEIHKKT